MIFKHGADIQLICLMILRKNKIRLFHDIKTWRKNKINPFNNI